jgi:hypothetical protein
LILWVVCSWQEASTEKVSVVTKTTKSFDIPTTGVKHDWEFTRKNGRHNFAKSYFYTPSTQWGYKKTLGRPSQTASYAIVERNYVPPKRFYAPPPRRTYGPPKFSIVKDLSVEHQEVKEAVVVDSNQEIKEAVVADMIEINNNNNEVLGTNTNEVTTEISNNESIDISNNLSVDVSANNPSSSGTSGPDVPAAGSSSGTGLGFNTAEIKIKSEGINKGEIDVKIMVDGECFK